MLLIKLQNEEKFAFLSLAHHIAHIDGEFEKEEEKDNSSSGNRIYFIIITILVIASFIHKKVKPKKIML